MYIILFSFYFFLPAGVANMVPVIAAKTPLIKNYNYPLDFGLTFRGKRILGDHKTVRGLVAGVLVGILTAIILSYVLPTLYKGVNPGVVGFLLSFGALFGDSVKSFFKRQVGINSGKSWFPFDQIDYILGGILFSLFVVQLPIIIYEYIFIIYFFLHLVISYIGFLLRLKQSAV